MGKRLLIIDDDEGIRKLFRLSLEDTGVEVDTAASGQLGLNALDEREYDLVYLDLKMPGLNGVETLRGIRERNTSIPVYFITAFHQEFMDELRSAEEDGFDFEVMRKPFDARTLKAVTAGVLGHPTAVD